MLEMGFDIPVVAVSGGGRHISLEDDLHRAEMAVAKATLSKPFTKKQLTEALARAIN